MICLCYSSVWHNLFFWIITKSAQSLKNRSVRKKLEISRACRAQILIAPPQAEKKKGGKKPRRRRGKKEHENANRKSNFGIATRTERASVRLWRIIHRDFVQNEFGFCPKHTAIKNVRTICTYIFYYIIIIYFLSRLPAYVRNNFLRDLYAFVLKFEFLVF